jgi:hypothetical protein
VALPTLANTDAARAKAGKIIVIDGRDNGRFICLCREVRITDLMFCAVAKTCAQI